MKLPLALRNRLADLVVDAFHDADARSALEALSGTRTGVSLVDVALADRVGRARRLFDGLPLDTREVPLARALTQAAFLFDARLYFEMHELLEPYWMRAQGVERAAIQGLIQIAVALEHLADGNTAGARSLLHEGIAKIVESAIGGRELGPFAGGLRRCLDDVMRLGPDAASRFDWSAVPRFPRTAS